MYLMIVPMILATNLALVWSNPVFYSENDFSNKHLPTPKSVNQNKKVPYLRSYFHMGKKAVQDFELSKNRQITEKDRSYNVLKTPSVNTVNKQFQTGNVEPRNENVNGAYSWGYRWIDAFGNQMFREETSDGRGTVRGRYSFRDAYGIMRIVEYIADEYGFRTRIRSNEPGIVSSNPANAQIIRFEDENNIPERL